MLVTKFRGLLSRSAWRHFMIRAYTGHWMGSGRSGEWSGRQVTATKSSSFYSDWRKFVTDCTSYGGKRHTGSAIYCVCIQREATTEQHTFFKARRISTRRLNNYYCFIVL